MVGFVVEEAEDKPEESFCSPPFMPMATDDMTNILLLLKRWLGGGDVKRMADASKDVGNYMAKGVAADDIRPLLGYIDAIRRTPGDIYNRGFLACLEHVLNSYVAEKDRQTISADIQAYVARNPGGRTYVANMVEES